MTPKGLPTCTCGNTDVKEIEISLPTPKGETLHYGARICNSDRCNLVTLRTKKGEIVGPT